MIGILFVGLDISAELDALKRQIKNVRVGDSGYFSHSTRNLAKIRGWRLSIRPRKGKSSSGLRIRQARIHQGDDREETRRNRISVDQFRS